MLRLVAGAIAVLIIVGCLLACLKELNFTFGGKTASGTVVSTMEEFAGFNEDQATGTTPRFRYLVHYRFAADNEQYRGNQYLDQNLFSTGDLVEIQYIKNSPDRNRIRVFSVQLTSVVFIGVSFVLAVAILGWAAKKPRDT